MAQLEADPPNLSLRVSPVWARVPAGPRSIPVLIELEAGDLPIERRRPALSLVLVLDVSGSMAGPPLEQVVRSVERILGLLQEDDRVGVVAFSTRATVVSELAKLDGPAKRAIVSRVARLFADDRTNVEAGLRLGAKLFPDTPEEDTRHALVLLSDGEPNEGATSREDLREIARSLRHRASIATLGYGARHDEAVLLAIAEGGGSCYRFISDPGVCQLELAQAVGAQGDIAIDGIELTLIPEVGVEVERVIGASPPRYSKEGMLVAVPDLAAKGTRALVVEISAKLDREVLSGRLLQVSARYRRAGFGEWCGAVAHASIDIGGIEPAADAPAVAKALLVRADGVRADARALADRGQFDGAAAMLRGFMAEIERAPSYEKADGSPLSEAWEQLLDEAMAMERRPSREAFTVLKASTAMKSLAGSDGVRASSRPLGRTAISMTTGVAGTSSAPAFLVITKGPGAGKRHRLGDQNTLGRTVSADISLRSSQVSRRHADVFVVEGDYFVADLGSTNVTSVNGSALGRAPHMLKNGDRISVGDIDLVFERPR